MLCWLRQALSHLPGNGRALGQGMARAGTMPEDGAG